MITGKYGEYRYDDVPDIHDATIRDLFKRSRSCIYVIIMRRFFLPLYDVFYMILLITFKER